MYNVKQKWKNTASNAAGHEMANTNRNDLLTLLCLWIQSLKPKPMCTIVKLLQDTQQAYYTGEANAVAFSCLSWTVAQTQAGSTRKRYVHGYKKNYPSGRSYALL